MKKIIISFLLIILVLIAGFIFKDISVMEVEAKPEDRFVKIKDWGNNFIMYDKETKVQYFVFVEYKFGGGMTVLLDAEGKPLLYGEE